MLKPLSILTFICLSIFDLFGSDPYPRNFSIDIQHYQFTIEINDSTNIIAGTAEVTILFKKSETSLSLDLVGKSIEGKGMTVSAVTFKNKPLTFSHKDNRLNINLISSQKEGEEIMLIIKYEGVPADGLIIGTNKFGDRTFFGDNWPNRAHNWIPTIDHPYDKASCEFIIIAPDHYQSIANGVLVEKKTLPKNRTLTHWKEVATIPTKVMVIGVANFVTTSAGEVSGVPIETWVYPQNKEEGFIDFKIAPQITQYFVEQIAPFPYQKLANVQSTTRFGGMENSSNIFYFENSVTGKNEREALIAHEIAHQWFGDSASEMDWYHVWLSEGFATYFTNLYYEGTYGRDQLVERMQTQRKEVLAYFKENPAPVIDTTIVDINKVLSTNTYQKGSWVLHMLRKEVGDEAFWLGVREYYKTYQHGNAMTSDLRKIMERVSGKNLEAFFEQWLEKGGHPILSGSWSYDPNKKLIKVKLMQNQVLLFNTPIEVGIKDISGKMVKQTVQLSQKNAEFTFSASKRPKEVILDPDTWLLFDGNILQK